MSGTEDSILNSIPDFQDGGDSGGVDTGGSDDGGSAQTSAQPTHGEGGGQSSAQPTQTGGTQPQQQEPVRRRHDGLVEVPNAENPNTRDLVDPITGRTVARGGIERRVFEDGQRHARENATLKQQLGNATQQLANINQVTQEAVRLNVAPNDQIAAIRVMADFLRDPVKTLQYLVEEVKSKGYPIPFLEQGVTPGMDMNAIQRMIDNKFAPFTQQQEQARMQQAQRAKAESDLNNFLSENQEANANLDVLAEMLNAQPGLPLQSAYTKMIRWAHENNLDWTQPLKQQIAALQQQPQQPAPQQPPQQQQPQRPLPGRRSANANGAQPMGNGSVQQYNENASWSDIIRHAMQEHGVTLN
jgi:flagellar hook-basal body complex protein FliE